MSAKQISFLNKISFKTKKPQILIDSAKYSGLRLTFQYQNHNGHMGARKFWHEYLPTLKFYNPALQVDVLRVRNNDKSNVRVPCKLEVISKDGEVLKTINMKNQKHTSIMDRLLEEVEHKPVPTKDLIEI
ncbi:hypothetical protein Kpol_2002p74 [Vanderwaltozyma polyspora DSM 70294]|uniref:Ribosomal protein/NADH dehydrogenase domain-containing protein n=1 Tax=Vanderwaltozyma polyspora (strain ATCC 22028 / DSM 70294 / BCRC 21397 / CBS 2163 / NBRC 10782 / NRRL Y-8283 / UCD 57-17) TaxID=436907 RepID=A7TFI9_VANPO|nr:uncharacterized protein Kpol_2002p74 [Vanderwaltozyma polyspora DSM 70294]EDO19003.1 hypothetical protein Kpol_2002p74 [Vanderwaltozyma polyspora DSM 70294]